MRHSTSDTSHIGSHHCHHPKRTVSHPTALVTILAWDNLLFPSRTTLPLPLSLCSPPPLERHPDTFAQVSASPCLHSLPAHRGSFKGTVFISPSLWLVFLSRPWPFPSLLSAPQSPALGPQKSFSCSSRSGAMGSGASLQRQGQRFNPSLTPGLKESGIATAVV